MPHYFAQKIQIDHNKRKTTQVTLEGPVIRTFPIKWLWKVSALFMHDKALSLIQNEYISSSSPHIKRYEEAAVKMWKIAEKNVREYNEKREKGENTH